MPKDYVVYFVLNLFLLYKNYYFFFRGFFVTSKERHELRYQRRVAKRNAKKQRLIKKYGNLESVFTFSNMYNSYKLCKKNVGWKESTQRYKMNALIYVTRTLNEIKAQTFKSRGFYKFDVMERGKIRHIQSVHISERVLQRCLCDNSLIPLISNSFIYDNGACIKGKGIDFSINRFVKHLRNHYKKYGNKGYVLFFDFSKYFESIDHEVLKNIIIKHFGNDEKNKIVQLTHSLINDFEGDKGVGLGSQISQICALTLPNKLDHYIKEVLYIKGYGRYMDDGYLIHHDKKYLQKCLDKILEICNDLKIVINKNKTKIIKLTRPLIFLKKKFILTSTGKIVITPARKSVVRMRRKLKKFKKFLDTGKMKFEEISNSLAAWLGSIVKLQSYKVQMSVKKLYFELFLSHQNT